MNLKQTLRALREKVMKSIAMSAEIRTVVLLMAATVMIMGYGCGDDDDEVEIVLGEARIRALHLSADAPDVDIYVDQAPPAAITDLAFGESTGYLDIDPGTYTFNITAAMAAPPPPSVLDVGPLQLDAGMAYTAVALNEVSMLEALALVDDLTSPGAGNIRARAIHAAPGVDEVDIWEVSDPLNPTLLYENVNFGDVGDYLVLPAASYTLGFDVDNDAVPDLNFSTGPLPEGSIINIFAVNDGPDVFLVAQFENGITAQIDPS
jgi:hypothetical protein